MADLNQFLGGGGGKYFKVASRVDESQIASYTVPPGKVFYATYVRIGYNWQGDYSVYVDGVDTKLYGFVDTQGHGSCLPGALFAAGTTFTESNSRLTVVGYLGTLEDL